MPWPTDDPEKYFADRGFVLFVVKDATEADYSADLLLADRRLRLQWRYGAGATAEEERSELNGDTTSRKSLTRRFPAAFRNDAELRLCFRNAARVGRGRIRRLPA